ncbi:DUF1206 domain-containing protein [Methylobacterium sp. Leaf466]|uniref:DUF1206 domain-containing protein n=1 Tax=Methylobacterium sp. Leaf466 TaxID=1736386 RepID=UPI0006FB6BD5|nr:DUF1206 domain-containing protein [Methylobacterium sp. Leaf466]KQT78422.1 hypothetical protein ASG59_08040 [Methylobacterium sp. Leaf466]
MDAPTLEHIARLGYGARGAVYCLVGGLAVLAAVGTGGQTGGSKSALTALLTQPFGRIWLGLVALGLLCFAVWRIVEAATDADRHGRSGKGLAVRAAHVVSGLTNAALALSAGQLALGLALSSRDNEAAQDWTAWLLGQPFGQWLTGIVGLVVIGIGLGFLRKGWSGDVVKHLALPAGAGSWAVPLGRLGFAARGVVFALIGGFLVLAAVHSRSSEVKGLGESLVFLRSQPFGWVLLGLTAAGLFAFGLFSFVQARYRRIDAPDMADGKAALKNAASSLPGR